MELAKTVKKYKKRYDVEVEKNREKAKYDRKRKKHFAIKPNWDFYLKAVREFYADMKNVSNDDPDFQRTIKVAIRAFEDIAELRDSVLRPVKKGSAFGDDRKCKALKIRLSLCSWFVNVQETLKGLLPKRLFKLKVKELHNEWFLQNSTEPEKPLKFGNQWIKEWDSKYGVSSRKLNKRFPIKKENLAMRLEDYLQNVWTFQKNFL